ncbi:MAG TPA: hypothetical protein VG796_01385 [Verrucomicrobiales bacterium]|nr:hypothetical protein [Verrucomicrobiales bacterium]
MFAARKWPHRHTGYPAPWWWIAGFLGALGLNKELDFQTLLIQWGRTLSRMTGMYSHRRMIELVFLAAGGVVFALLLIWWIRRYRLFLRTHPLVVTGTVLVLLYVGLRAVETLHGGKGVASSERDRQARIIEGSGVSLLLIGACAGLKPRVAV